MIKVAPSWFGAAHELEENPFLDQQEKDEYDDANSASAAESKDFQDYDEYMYDDVPDYKAEYQNYFNTEDAPNIAIKARHTLKTKRSNS